MKNHIIISMVALLTSLSATSQLDNIETVYLNENVSTHFTSDENIDHTDLSTTLVTGDLPLSNVLRLKPIARTDQELGYATIIGESFFLQFKLKYTDDVNKAHKHINLGEPLKQAAAGTSKARIFDNPNYRLTSGAIETLANKMLDSKSSINSVVAKSNKIHMKLNNIWVVEDYIFLDYTIKNKTNLPYDIDEIRYKVIDKKIVKAESNQDQELKPKYVTNKEKSFDKEYRNVTAIKKFTYPDDKSFIIQIAEDQLSGRTITLHITYADILNAKTFNAGS